MNLLQSGIIDNGVVLKVVIKHIPQYIHLHKEEATELIKARMIYNRGKGFLHLKPKYKEYFEILKCKLEQAA